MRLKNRGIGFFVFIFLAASLSWGAGRHQGEASKIEAEVTFLDPSGFTTTDASGIHYHFWGYVFDEPKIYPESTYGVEHPLYFVGTNMNFTVILRSTSDRGAKKFRIRIQALSHTLETDGSPGMELAAPKEWIIESLAPGESRIFDGSIYLAPDANLPSGLDITKIRISHLNEGSNDEAGLIKEEIAVWCPPNVRP
ncbi:MAG: hypothetical protein HY547_04380 [Elusimicrobia bacterium]|nr:hypothetical protein [Elusimicrobiota bacterium]